MVLSPDRAGEHADAAAVARLARRRLGRAPWLSEPKWPCRSGPRKPGSPPAPQSEPFLTGPPLSPRRHTYAGSADFFATAVKPDGTTVRILGDYKTSASGPWGSVAFQLSGYRYADFYLSGDAGRDSEELAVPEVDECWAVWLRADGFVVYPMHVDRDVHRQLLYIDQCRMADEACRDYKLDALPHPETVRKARLQDVGA